MMMTNPNTLSIVGTKRQHGRVVLVIEDNAGRVDRSLISRWEVAKRDLAAAVHDFAACCGAEERTTRRDRYGLPVYQGLMAKIDWKVACVETDVLLGCDVYEDDED